jgi:type IV pilus assembly protein PilA
MKTNIVKSAKAGFSLVEMLVVIAVIGIIAAIAVPTIGNITSSAKVSKDKRNAQNLASVYSAAIAAGASFTNDPGDTAANTLVAGELATGIVGSADAGFNTTTFKVPAISDLAAALGYIGTDFSYNP